MVAADLLVAQNVGFWLIAAVMVVGALRVVTSNNVVHAALWLVVVLAGAAAQRGGRRPHHRRARAASSRPAVRGCAWQWLPAPSCVLTCHLPSRMTLLFLQPHPSSTSLMRV